MSGVGMRDCFLFLSEDRSTGMGFRMAYKVATQTKNNKDLCASLGSIICAVFPRLEGKVEIALKRIGVRPCFVWLPTDAENYGINLREVPEMDLPSMLVIFGCCILILLKDHKDEWSYMPFMYNCIRELQKITGCDRVNADLIVLIEFERARAIRAMLGATPDLRKNIMKCIIGWGKRISSDPGISTVCQYLCNMLAWSGMDEFIAMHEMLVKPQSPILNLNDDPVLSLEAENLAKAFDVVKSHSDPRYFMNMASDAELMKLESSRFPTLIAVAKELVKGGDGSGVDRPGTSTAGAIHGLVKLHLTAMPGKLRPKSELKPECETE